MAEYQIVEGTLKMEVERDDPGTIRGNFTPIVRLRNAATQPYGGNLMGKYRISPGIIHISYLWVWNSSLRPGTPTGTGVSRYYFVLPDVITDDMISGNIAEHGSVRMFDGTMEMSGHPNLYNAIPRSVIAEVDKREWGPSSPFGLTKAGQYITVGIWWLT